MPKPELTLADWSGAHNRNPETRARLLKGGSYKKQRIVVIVPAVADIAPKVALSHWNLAFPPNNGVARIIAEGMEVGDAYSSAIEQIVAHPDLSKWEYLLTIETDNAPPSDGVLALCAQMEQHPEFAAISGAYYTKGSGGCLQAWGDPTDPVLNFRPLPPVAGQLIECCGLGMGFCLWRMSLFHDKRLRRPWFKTQADKSGVGTQDLYFASDARKYGFRFAVDCACLVGHWDAKEGIMW